MLHLQFGGSAAKRFVHSSISVMKPASKMTGAETISVEMMPTVVMMIVVSPNDELASVVRSIWAIIGAVIRSAVGSWHISPHHIVTGTPGEDQGNHCCADHQYLFHRLHVWGSDRSNSLNALTSCCSWLDDRALFSDPVSVYCSALVSY